MIGCDIRSLDLSDVHTTKEKDRSVRTLVVQNMQKNEKIIIVKRKNHSYSLEDKILNIYIYIYMIVGNFS